MTHTKDALVCHARARDASHFHMIPSAVVHPETIDDIVRMFDWLRTNRHAVTFRAAGTSLSGQSVTDDILVDVRGSFTDIQVLDDGARVRAGAGASIRDVNAHLRRHGRRLGPDPGSESVATVGGVIANNSSGMLAGNIATAYATLESMVFVLPNGRVVDTADPGADITLRLHEGHLVHGLLQLRRRIRERPATMMEIRRQYALKNTMGYGVNTFLDFQRPLDLARHLIIGSEGTLAFVAEATFRTVPLSPLAATAWAEFPDAAEAVAAVPGLVDAGFDAVELVPVDAGHCALLLELQAETSEELQAWVRQCQPALAELPGAPELTTGAAQRRAWHQLRRGLYPRLAASRPAATTAMIEDFAVPLDDLPAVTVKLRALLARHRYDPTAVFGHAGDGNLQFVVTVDVDDEAAVRRYGRFMRDFVRLVIRARGTLRAEHGTGRAMAPYVADQFGDELYGVMREIKALFDPEGILNPDVVISTQRDAHLRNLKTIDPLHPAEDANPRHESLSTTATDETPTRLRLGARLGELVRRLPPLRRVARRRRP